jgi:hypothetical protein
MLEGSYHLIYINLTGSISEDNLIGLATPVGAPQTLNAATFDASLGPL